MPFVGALVAGTLSCPYFHPTIPGTMVIENVVGKALCNILCTLQLNQFSCKKFSLNLGDPLNIPASQFPPLLVLKSSVSLTEFVKRGRWDHGNFQSCSCLFAGSQGQASFMGMPPMQHSRALCSERPLDWFSTLLLPTLNSSFLTGNPRFSFALGSTNMPPILLKVLYWVELPKLIQQGQRTERETELANHQVFLERSLHCWAPHLLSSQAAEMMGRGLL